jgi:hypothetical protein
MNKDELIVKQQLLIEEYKQKLIDNGKLYDRLHGKFYSIGQPLNDNRLKFNEEQLHWCMSVFQMVEGINFIDELR